MLNDIKDYWNNQPCNINHSKKNLEHLIILMKLKKRNIL